LGRTTDTREQTRLAWKGLSAAGTQASLGQWYGQFQALFLRRRAETSASQDWRVGARIQLPTGEYGCFPSTAPTL